MLIGLGTTAPVEFVVYTGTTVWVPPEATCTTYAAASPFPFSVSSPGATVAISMLFAVCVVVPFVIVTCAVPVATVVGTRNVIRLGETATIGAAFVFPSESMIATDVPPRTVGNGAVAVVEDAARFCPPATVSEPGAIEVALVFEAERISGTFAIGVVPAVGASETPRNTSPAFALLMVVNVSLAAVVALVLAITSVIATSLFGSAP